MSWPEVSTAIEALGGSFNSVDLRIAAVKREQWTPVLSSVYFSNEPPAKVTEEHDSIRKRMKNFVTKEFAFFFQSYPYEEWAQVAGKFAEGNIDIESSNLLGEKVDLLKLSVLPRPMYLAARGWPVVGAEWSLAGQQATNQFLGELQKLRGGALVMGYDDEYQLISDVLQVKDFTNMARRYVVIGIPIYASISEVVPQSDLISVTVRRHTGLRDLQLNFNVLDPDLRTGNYEVLSRLTRRVKNVTATRTEFEDTTITYRFGRMQVDLVQVRLLHRAIPLIDIGLDRVTIPPRKPTEPLTVALSAFCSLETLREQLTSPETHEEKSVKAGRVFEGAVAWLLALHGYSVVRLEGRNEQLRVPPSEYEIGALDILAHKPRKLFLVECDTSIPDEKKIHAILAVKDRLQRILPRQARFTFEAVVFTPRDVGQFESFGVPIADRRSILALFNGVLKGRELELENCLAPYL